VNVVLEHFIDANKMVKLGLGSVREIGCEAYFGIIENKRQG